MNENFINFHVLISHSPSCLNRDDMNMQKSAIFGGKRRVRVSSQSLKRTMRISDYYRGNFPEKSIRTRNLGLLVEKLSENLMIDPALVVAGYEDVFYYLWKEKKLPVNVDPLKSKLKDLQERRRLARVFEKELGEIVGFACNGANGTLA